MDKPLSLIESLMSRKANEFSEISQVYFRAGRKELTELIDKFFSAGRSSADAVIDVAFVKIRFWSVVVGEKIFFDGACEEVGVARSHFGSHSNTVDLFVVDVTKRKTVECENQFS